MASATKRDETPETEKKYHSYLGYEIPWYVHVLWVSFWVLCIYYVIRYQFPAMGTELFNPP